MMRSGPLVLAGMAMRMCLLPFDVLRRSVEVLAGPIAAAPAPPAPRAPVAPRTNPVVPSMVAPTEEVRVMSYDSPARQDRDLQDSMLKLVQYRVLFVKREYEHVFGESEEMVHDNMDGTAFVGWKIAEFMQELRDGKIDVPRKWAQKNYPPPDCHCVDGDKLTDLPAEDKKYLRVYFEVQERYVREKFRFEETQVDVLREIAQRLGGKSS